jgi:hypothetical protein
VPKRGGDQMDRRSAIERMRGMASWLLASIRSINSTSQGETWGCASAQSASENMKIMRRPPTVASAFQRASWRQ